MQAGRRRFWIVVLSFAIANTAVWVTYHHVYGPQRHRLLRVENFAPGEDAIVAGRPTFTWQFNLDVAPTSGKEPPVITTPAIHGRFAWPTPRTLAFTPDEELPRATKITLSLSSENIRTPEGFRLARAFAASILTTPLHVLSVRQAALEDNDRYVIEMEFSDRVLPADVSSHLSFRDADGHTLGHRLHGEAVSHTVRVLTDSVPPPVRAPGASRSQDEEARHITAAFRQGLAGLSGPVGLQKNVEMRITLEKSLAATDMQAISPSAGMAMLRIRFNGEVNREALKQVLSVEPSVPFMLAHSSSQADLMGDFVPGMRYAVKIAAAPAGADRKKFPRPDTFSALVPDRQSGVWFEHDEGYLSAAGNRTLLAHAVNVPDVVVSVWRVYDNNLVAWRNSPRHYRWSDTTPYSEPIATQKIRLSGEKNKVEDIRLELDKLLPPTASRDGVYRVTLQRTAAVSPYHDRHEDFEDDESPRFRSHGGNSAVFTLSDIGLTAKQTRNGLMVWAVSLTKAQPLGHVRIRVFSTKNQPLGEAITNADGLARIEDIQCAEGERASLVLADQLPAPLPRIAETALAATRPAVPATGPFADADDEWLFAAPAPATAPARPLTPALSPEYRGEGEKAVARNLTWLDLRSSAWNFADSDLNGRPYLRQGHEAFVYTERGVYRPGETVQLRAIVRSPDHGTPTPFPAKWQIRRPDYRDWRANVVTLDVDGAAAWALQLPADLPTGRWTACIGLPGESGPSARYMGQISFQVEDFMPDRMKVGLSFNGPGLEKTTSGEEMKRFTIADKPIEAHIQADYLFGRPGAGLTATLSGRLEPAWFSPPQYNGWTFGDTGRLVELPGTSPLGAIPRRSAAHSDEHNQTLTLDDKGHAHWDMDLRTVLELDKSGTKGKQPSYLGPWTLCVSASVAEAGGRAVSTSSAIEVDALSYYIGVRRAKPTAGFTNVPTAFEVALVRAHGHLAAADAALDIAVFRESFNTSLIHRDGRYHYQSTRVLDEIKTAAQQVAVLAGRGSFAITLKENGAYIVRVRDAKTGAMTSLSFYVSDGTPWEDNISRENPERLQVVLMPADEAAATRPASQPAAKNKTKEPMFRVGQKAIALVRSPFAGKLLLSIETDQVISVKIIDMPASQVSVPIDVTEACRPNAYVTATVIRAVNPNAKWRTHRAFGAARLTLDPADRRLDMQIAAPTDVRPRSPLAVKVAIIDSRGMPVRNAAVSVAAVDEGICQLTHFVTPNPLAFFSGNRALGVKSGDLYSLLMPEVPRLDSQSPVGGDKMDDFSRNRTPVQAKRVKPVALVSEILHTDEQGMATAHFAVPEFAGKLRVMAISYAGNCFGSSDQGVLVRSPILLQSSFPRFAAPGDRFTAPLVLFNNSSLEGEATITAELIDSQPQSPLAFATTSEHRIEIPVTLKPGAQQRVSVDFVANSAVGVAHIRLAAKMGDESFEESIELPIRPASPTITRGGCLIATANSPLKLAYPGGMLAGTEQFEVKVSQFPTLELPHGLDYLDRYPHGCCEQTISTCFPLAYLSDIGRQIAPGVFEPQRVGEKVQTGIYRLIAMQTADGGLAAWPGSREGWPWASVYAAHFIVEAEKAGHPIPEDFRRHLLSYVRRLLDKSGDDGDLLEVQAYGCYVLALSGRPERAVMSRLGELANASGASALIAYAHQRASAKLYLAAAWLAAGRRDLAMGLLPQAPLAPRASRQLGGNVGSSIRDRAFLLSTLIAAEPQHPMLPALVQQLADSRQWHSTQDTAFAVMAIGKYLRQLKPEKPYDSATLRLLRYYDAVLPPPPVPRGRAGEGASASCSIEGRVDEQVLATALGDKPLTWTAGDAPSPISAAPATRPATLPTADAQFEIRAAGPDAAKAYVAWLQNGVPLSPPADCDNGLKVRRRYTDEKGGELSKSIRSGDLVRVEVSVESAIALENLVIEDLLPACLEVENPRLATSAAVHRRASRSNGQDTVFDDSRLDVRDDRLILIGRLWAGRSTYTYLARAVAPGTFVVPPVKAECMYDIAINSLSGGGGKLTVVPLGR